MSGEGEPLSKQQEQVEGHLVNCTWYNHKEDGVEIHRFQFIGKRKKKDEKGEE